MSSAHQSQPGSSSDRRATFPKLTARENWGNYAAGLFVEFFYGFLLCLVAFAIAWFMLAVVG